MTTTPATQPTRSEMLIDSLKQLSEMDQGVKWASIMDYDGLPLASYPSSIEDQSDLISATVAQLLLTSEKIGSQVQIGKWRYVVVGGSDLQVLTLALNKDCVLALGLLPKTRLSTVLGYITQVVPDMIRTLDMTSKSFSEPNTMVWRQVDLGES
jgi:predicted regulator of Ras-like GTPase activity (Roadblock/LC7/MglB family)